LKNDAATTDASTAGSSAAKIGRKEKPRKKRTILREKCDAAKHSDESTAVVCAPHTENDPSLAEPGADSETLYDVTTVVSSLTDTETVARAVCTTARAVCTTALELPPAAGEEKGAWAAGGGPEDKWQAGERILCFHGPLIYEAKIQQVGGPFIIKITSVANPDRGSGIRCLFDPLDPGSGMGKKPRSGSGLNIPGHISESLVTIFGLKIWYLNALFGADPGSGIFLTRDPGWENSDPGSGINIPGPQH
jgi:hypothetical protein